MTKPLALISYEDLLPGSQVANRLHELGYRTQVVPSPAVLVESTQKEKPLVVLLDLRWSKGDVLGVIVALRKHPDTLHVPLLAFTTVSDAAVHTAARTAGASLVAKDDALLSQLPQLLEQVLALE